MDEKLFYLGFSAFPGIGPVKFSKLLSALGSAENAWNADQKSLVDILGENLTARFTIFRKTFSLRNYAEKIENKKIQFITLINANYPKLLKQIPYPPFVLYVKGAVSMLQNQKTIAVVGTRKITNYGQEVTRMLTTGLVQNNFTVVSGLALGVDACAHGTTLDNSGTTIAVLGSGVDTCTPSQNKYLYDRILDKRSVVLSPFPPGATVAKGQFLARNAIIAGLSLGVLVTEGAEDSGSLTTAKKCLEYNRPVFAVPGPITSSLSKGANSLLQNGAVAVTSVEDILKTLQIRALKKKPLKLFSANQEEQKIIDVLQNGALHFDQIIKAIGKPSKEIAATLSMLEIQGIIRADKNGRYALFDL